MDEQAGKMEAGRDTRYVEKGLVVRGLDTYCGLRKCCENKRATYTLVCKNAFITTKNKSCFIKLVNRIIKQILSYSFRYVAA